MMAHEIMHNLGLPDEYDYKQHFTNDQMGFWQKVGVFFMAVIQPELPADHDQSIMGGSDNKPLPRDYEAMLHQ